MSVDTDWSVGVNDAAIKVNLDDAPFRFYLTVSGAEPPCVALVTEELSESAVVLNPFNAEATFILSTRMQQLF